MTNQKKPSQVAKPVATKKPVKKLVPRTAPKASEMPPLAAVLDVPPVAAPAAAPTVPQVPATAAATAGVRAPRKPSREDETVARHQKVLADALVKAQAIKYDQPKLMKQQAAQPKKAAKPEKPAKARKLKLVRDSYAMPEAEYARIGELKKRLAGLGSEIKKSELLRAGIAMLAALNDAELKAVTGRVERIKTGRPAKEAKK